MARHIKLTLFAVAAGLARPLAVKDRVRRRIGYDGTYIVLERA